MTRISTFGQSQVLLQGLMQNQIRLFEDQKQVNTGKVADDFQGLGNDTSTVMSAKSLLSRTGSYRDTVTSLTNFSDFNDTHLSTIIDTARDFQNTILTAVAQEEILAFDDVLEQSFAFIANTLNARLDGNYVFGGGQTEIPPVISDDINDLIAAATAGDLFQNDGDRLRAQVADGVEVEYSFLADDVAELLFESFKRIAEFHNDPLTGPIDGKLTDAQRVFLENELADLEQAIDQIQLAQANNGLLHNRLTSIDEQHAESEVFLQGFISNIEDVNFAEAVSRLNADQTAVEASYRVFGTLAELNILNYI